MWLFTQQWSESVRGNLIGRMTNRVLTMLNLCSCARRVKRGLLVNMYFDVVCLINETAKQQLTLKAVFSHWWEKSHHHWIHTEDYLMCYVNPGKSLAFVDKVTGKLSWDSVTLLLLGKRMVTYNYILCPNILKFTGQFKRNLFIRLYCCFSFCHASTV